LSVRLKVQISLHDVSPRHEETVREIHSTLRTMGVAEYSMLVVPDFHGKWPLGSHEEFSRWLIRLRGEGVAMLLHGFTHMALERDLRPFDRIRSWCFTRGEGEFLGLNTEEALLRIEKGRLLLETALEGEVSGFVAPAWLYSSGTMNALHSAGFSYAESRSRIWNPSTGETLLRSPVVNYAGGSTVKRAFAGLWVSLSRVVLKGQETVRFALHPEDFLDRNRRKGVLDHLDKLLHSNSRSREAALIGNV